MIEKKNTVASGITALQKKKIILTRQISHIHMFDGLATRLGKGESEAITLTVEIDAD